MWLELARDGVRLACCDFGGAGPAVLLLHGLAGHAGEWAATAAGLTASHRVLGLDQRGHGRSERHPGDVSREAFVGDVERVIEALGLAPVILVGQSMGANTAFLVGGSRPDLVAALVVAEASPHGPVPELAERIRAWLDRWPVPFTSPELARSFFRSQGLTPDPWTAGLELRRDGLWPGFDKQVMVECIADLASRDPGRSGRPFGCPTLIVRGERGQFTAVRVEALAERLTQAQAVTIPGAGHDVHLEAPDGWLRALQSFLAHHRPV